MEKQLKRITVNGYDVLVDEDKNNRPKKGDAFYKPDVDNVFVAEHEPYHGCLIVHFASPELNLDVPVLPCWREFEVGQAAIKEDRDRDIIPNYRDTRNFKEGFIEGHNHNKAEFTEGEAVEIAVDTAKMILEFLKKKQKPNVLAETLAIVNSLRESKKPKYYVMEDKLTTTPDGKQKGIVKQLIY